MSEGNARAMVAREFDAITGPLRTLVENLDAQIVEARGKLDELTTARHDAAKMLRLADPTFEPKPAPKANGHRAAASEGKVAEIAAWLAERSTDLGIFTAQDLQARDDFVFAKSTTSSALKVLHERGVLRLDRQGVGGQRFYRVA